jgi:hypothetical protein
MSRERASPVLLELGSIMDRMDRNGQRAGGGNFLMEVYF